MDRHRYRSRMVNQWFSYDIGWWVDICNILFNIPVNSVYHTSHPGANTRDYVCVVGTAGVFVYIGAGCCDNSRILDDDTGVCGIYLWPQRNIDA